jgi:3D (Asp-Asp-Asp) domain-containing protein
MNTLHDRKTTCSNGFKAGLVLPILGLLGLVGLEAWAPSPNSAVPTTRVFSEIEREAPIYSAGTLTMPASIEHLRSVFRVSITVTGYSSTMDQTDDSPLITAMNTTVHPGMLALSRDLLREFTRGAPFQFGDVVELEGLGVFTVEDTMNPRYEKRADIWFQSREAATRWGTRTLHLSQLTPISQAGAYLAQSDDRPTLAD